MGEDVCFTLQTDFGVDVGRVDGDVAEPGADGVDVHAGAQKSVPRPRGGSGRATNA